MSSFIGSVEKAISDYNMINSGDTVIVALSGGADSVSLLNALNSLKGKYSLTIKAAHLNHNLRGAEALRDENFVRKVCAEKNIELFVKSVDIKNVSENKKISDELAGREERYKFFSELSEEYNAKIATAHTADDNAETVIFNLVRGSGLNGICGIKPVRDNIIRPLINLSREDVENYCRENSIEFVVDSTNLSEDYTRNKIRRRIIPVMKEINPRVINTISEETKVFSDYNSYLELKINDIIDDCVCENGYSVEKLKKIPENLRMSVIYELLKRCSIQPQRRHIELVVSILEKGSVDLNGNYRAVSKQGTLRFIKTGDKNYFSEIELKIPLLFEYNSKNYSVKEIKSDSADALKKSVLEKKPVFRTRKQGDKFTLAKRKVTKSLKKLFNEIKIPEEKRDKILILADENEVFWIEGIGASESARSYDNNGFIIEIN